MNAHDARADAAAILRAAIAAADPHPLVARAVAGDTTLQQAPDVRLIAVGKAACAMAAAARAALRRPLDHSVVIVPAGSPCAGAVHASHPLPDARSLAAGRAVTELVRRAPPDAHVLVLLSGGASALMVDPVDGIDVADYARCVALLQRCGADIRALNSVRRCIDRLKGGGLASLAHPRPVTALVLSDVADNDLATIASGPLTPAPCDAAGALALLHLCAPRGEIPAGVRATLQRQAATRAAPQTTSAVRVRIIGDNALARQGAARQAEALGWRAVIDDEPLLGEARTAAAALVQRARALRASAASGEKVCLVCGGETTVAVKGSGRGGRNQELVLAAALQLRDAEEMTVASAGTDGVDGTSDAAGAVADARLVRAARAAGVAPETLLDDNDSHAFFARAGGAIHTGPTGTNVLDVQVVLMIGG